ncbi:hypothetical protein [Oryzobacter telluris]|uniref:hypothetical protein n=1 Tax=Oryzobacter telluris TaxID=3149179 RepID=UPI00370D5D52
MTNPHLLESLSRLESTGPEFGGFLANHGPMAVEALTHVGGDEAIPHWLDRYLRELDAAPSDGHGVDDDSWPQRLGDPRLLGDWSGYLLRQSREVSWRDLLATWWPRLVEGMAASATHGMIRTAHAVRSLEAAGHEPDPLLVDELARGLGLWAARYDPVPSASRKPPTLDAVAALAALPRLHPDVPSRGTGINGRLRALDELSGLPDGLAGWRAPVDLDRALSAIVGAAAKVLLARPDAPIPFCHAVTAPAATRLVLPSLTPAVAARTVQVSWRVTGSLIAAFAHPRDPRESTTPLVSAIDVARLVDRLPTAAVEHGDEHVIKLSEAALREFAVSKDASVLVAADRFRTRVPATEG